MTKSSVITIFALSVFLAFGLGTLSGYNLDSNKTEIAKTIGLGPAEVAEIPLPDGRVVKVPSGHAVKLKMQYGGKTEEQGHSKTKVTGKAHGGYKVNPSATDTTSVAAPELDLTKDNEKGSGSAIDSLQEGANSGSAILLLAGIAFVAAGVLVIVFLKMMKLGIITASIGGVFIGTSLLFQAYPWMLIVAAVVVVGGIAAFVWWAWKTGRLKLTAEKIVGAIEKADEKTQKNIKATISEEVKTSQEKNIVKKTVSGIKQKL